MVGEMKLKEKLQMLMTRSNLNGQKLAKRSEVSDSEISRILQGKSRPGLDNAYRLAKAVGVTLDYLADDSADLEPGLPTDALSGDERKILGLIKKIGLSESLAILENARFLGYEIAMGRLVGAKPVVETEPESSTLRPSTSALASTSQVTSSVPIAAASRVSSASA